MTNLKLKIFKCLHVKDRKIFKYANTYIFKWEKIGVSHRGVKDVSDLLDKSVCQSEGLKRPDSNFGAEIANN